MLHDFYHGFIFERIHNGCVALILLLNCWNRSAAEKGHSFRLFKSRTLYLPFNSKPGFIFLNS
jgi:hypothetical protein